MAAIIEKVFGKKVNGTRVVPLVLKIVFIFVILLLVSNLISNYINLTMTRGVLLNQMNQLLVKDLKELHIFSLNQYEIYQYQQDYETAVQTIQQNAFSNLPNPEGVHSTLAKKERSIAFGVDNEGQIIFFASYRPETASMVDLELIEEMEAARINDGVTEGAVEFKLLRDKYFGVYKYNSRWDMYLIRAEETGEFYRETNFIFAIIIAIIIIMTVISTALGVYLIQRILRFVHVITSGIMEMAKSNKMHMIDMGEAPADEITYLGAALNATSSTIDTLMTIFRKFVTRDVAARAYQEMDIRLEGAKEELTILFSDIKSFTYMTEALGTDIIKLLNLHYDRTIRHIHDDQGVIGSIIGDALLAVYGTYHDPDKNKSVLALTSAYKIQDVAAKLRMEMNERREQIIKQHGALTKDEERVYKAVLLEVGVGIDGGEVFYGTIGSEARMTSTVIGDNVNSSSRLEGLTRIYKVPVICSHYIMEDVQSQTNTYRFMELDQVQVKGKTIGKRIYWPIKQESVDQEMEDQMNLYSKGLKLYYKGDWPKALEFFKSCTLPAAEIFCYRTEYNTCPKGWNGIWTMTTK